ncbi:unnamed protein product [Hymenolepis diminuta]|uniref:Uncharacterized protein n=1 Tax=Hymenolepis diminuta TaxID=6216 RepID=A0A564YWQ9_HYMDI|nr:unnamed protein product [Hymenolepis diminuta]
MFWQVFNGFGGQFPQEEQVQPIFRPPSMPSMTWKAPCTVVYSLPRNPTMTIRMQPSVYHPQFYGNRRSQLENFGLPVYWGIES